MVKAEILGDDFFEEVFLQIGDDGLAHPLHVKALVVVGDALNKGEADEGNDDGVKDADAAVDESAIEQGLDIIGGERHGDADHEHGDEGDDEFSFMAREVRAEEALEGVD